MYSSETLAALYTNTNWTLGRICATITECFKVKELQKKPPSIETEVKFCNNIDQTLPPLGRWTEGRSKSNKLVWKSWRAIPHHSSWPSPLNVQRYDGSHMNMNIETKYNAMRLKYGKSCTYEEAYTAVFESANRKQEYIPQNPCKELLIHQKWVVKRISSGCERSMVNSRA